VQAKYFDNSFFIHSHTKSISKTRNSIYLKGFGHVVISRNGDWFSEDLLTLIVIPPKALLVVANIEITKTIFCFFGINKNVLCSFQIYPDAIVQIAIQLAYMRLHGAPAATYETATTRQLVMLHAIQLQNRVLSIAVLSLVLQMLQVHEPSQKAYH